MRFLCAILFALLVFGSGCSVVSDLAGTTDDTPTDLAFSDDTDGSSPVTVAPELRDRGGVLRVGVVATTWNDPALIDEASDGEQQVADLLFDGLTSIDDGGLLQPAIATSWSASPDATSFTFELDPEARFSNGFAIAPDDVKYSLDRVVNLGTASLAANQLVDVASIDVLDSSVVITLTQPFADLPRLLASPIFGIVPAGSGDADGIPVTSSSLKVIADSNGKIILSPVDPEQSYVEGIEVSFFDDDQAVVEAYRTGLVDIASLRGPVDGAPSGEPSSDDSDEAANGSMAGEQRLVPGLDTAFFAMNLGNEAFADPRIRQALVLAVDNGFVASGVGRGAAPLEGLFPRSSSAWRPGVCQDCPYQPDEAREIIGTFGADTLPLIHVDHLDDPQSVATAEALVGDLRHIGLDVRARSHSPAAFASKAAAGELALFQFGIVGSWSSPEAYLGSQFATDGSDNVSSFSDPEVDRLLAEAARTLDDAERIKLYQQVETRILQFSVVIPLFERQQVLLVADRVNNVRSSALGWFDPEVVWMTAS